MYVTTEWIVFFQIFQGNMNCRRTHSFKINMPVAAQLLLQSENYQIVTICIMGQCIMSNVLTGILQILPVNFGNCPLGIIAILLNRIIQEISIHSSLFKSDKIFGTNEVFKLHETACIGILPFFNALWHAWHM